MTEAQIRERNNEILRDPLAFREDVLDRVREKWILGGLDPKLLPRAEGEIAAALNRALEELSRKRT